MRTIQRTVAAAVVVMAGVASVLVTALPGAYAADAAASAVAARVQSGATGPGEGGGPGVTPSVVLVSQPPASVCAGHRFRVGVWYQRISGGSRAYRVAVSGPRHRRFFYRHGRAPSARWRFWRVLAGRAGRYVTRYYTHRPGSTLWTVYRAITIANRC